MSHTQPIKEYNRRVVRPGLVVLVPIIVLKRDPINKRNRPTSNFPFCESASIGPGSEKYFKDRYAIVTVVENLQRRPNYEVSGSIFE